MAYIGKTPATGAFQKCDALSASATADYTLQVGSTNVVPESVNHMIVSLNGVIQQPTTAYTVSGAVLSFASALTSADTIDFVMLLGNVLDIGVCSDATVTKAKLANEVDVFAGTSLSAADLGSGIHIKTADSSASAHANVDELVVEGSAASGINILSGTGSDGSIYFGDSGDNNIGMVRYEHSGNNLIFRTNTADALTIDSAGRITKPLQPAFGAHPATEQTIDDTTQEQIVWGTERFDVGSNLASNVFTAPVTGKYQFSILMYFKNIDTDMARIAIQFDNSNRSYYLQSSVNGFDATLPYYSRQLVVLADMDASDTVDVKVNMTGGTDLGVGTDSFWTGMLVG